jgi:outer membrane protein
MVKKHFAVMAMVCLSLTMWSQDYLAGYIREGLEKNLALKQKEADYRQSLEALREARGLFYPALSVNARYTVSEGGRVIDLPIGDLLNPVYNTLNQLTASDLFPQVDNQQIRFLRPTEHETKLRLVQPVFNTDLYFNSRISKQLSQAEAVGVDQYKRELVAEIKKAYYAVAMTRSMEDMLKQTRLVLQENVRVNRRLVENNKVTLDNLYRSQTELSRFDQQLQTARKNRITAKAYFNFLLNKPLQDTVLIGVPEALPQYVSDPDTSTRQALERREELQMLEHYRRISALQVKMNRSARLPGLALVADYGFQGEQYHFNHDQEYVQASLVMTWNLFSGFQNRSRIREALIKQDKISDQEKEVREKISLQVIQVLQELKTAEAGLNAAESAVKSAREGFRLVQRRYGEGEASLLEFLDSRNTLTDAEENLILSRFAYLSDYADMEKTLAMDTVE